MAAVPPLIGRYQIKSLIGRGGMGSLYLAHDPNTSRLVTIKVLTATLDSPEFRERFARETRALAALSHPNIVNIYDSGEFQGSSFIVMEYVRGETLDELIQRRAPMSVSQKLKLMAELCAGLAHAHEAGIIHRDIKPANLMLDQQGHLKILDFGIAHVAESSKTRMGLPLTQINMSIGTPGYMSPEQIDGGNVDHRSDIFSVGAVCYELLSYNVAFGGANTQAIERNILQGRPVSLATQNPELDPEIDEIVQRALKKDPNKRFQDAGTFERSLEKVRARLGPDVQASPVRRPTPPSPTKREVNQARAEAAYQRAAQALAEGGREAARRFAAEALAEDPSHVQARSLLAGLDPRSPVAPTSRSEDDLPPTMIGTSFGAMQAAADAAATIIVPPSLQKKPHLPAARQPAPKARAPEQETRQEQRPRVAPWQTWTSPGPRLASLWKRHSTPILAVAALVLVVGVIAGAVWFVAAGPSGELLTIARPTGGTILAPGIKCGTQGNDCTTRRPSGEIVELTIEADAGLAFQRYIGDCAPAGRTLMTGPRNCSVEFGPDGGSQALPPATQTLTISPVPTGGRLEGVDISCGTNGSVCSASVPEGVLAVVKPIADDGFTFMGFTGDCKPMGQTQMAGPRTCGATFSPTAQVSAVPPPTPGRQPTPQPPKPPTTTVAGGPSIPGPPTAGGSGSPGTPSSGDKPVSASPPVVVSQPPVVAADKAPPGPVEKPVTDEVFAKGKIQELLKGWCAAYEAVDPGAVQVLYPDVNMKQLEIQLNKSKYNSVQCTIGEPTYVALDAVKGTAKVRAEIKRIFVHTFRSQKPDIQEVIATIQLRRADERSPWLISQAEYVLKPK